MKINLANSIRKHRKNRKMTQEQLAEALGVSVGAVYKWEAGLSLPELNLIVEIADFFDESVDALLDYDMKDNRQGAIVDRLRTYLNNKDCSGLSEAEKALKKYPHSFDVVYESAQLYRLSHCISCAIRIWADSWSCNCIREFDELYGAASN